MQFNSTTTYELKVKTQGYKANQVAKIHTENSTTYRFKWYINHETVL